MGKAPGGKTEQDDDVLADAIPAAARGPDAKALLLVRGVWRRCGGWAGDFVGFCWRWYWTRPRDAFWLGMPAVLVGGALTAVAAVARQTPTSELISRYQRQAHAAVQRKDLTSADIYFQRLLHLDPRNRDALYGLAITAEQNQQLGRARELMQQLAPADGTGDPRAHFWLARQLAQPDATLDAAGIRLAEHHLRQTVQTSPRHLEAHRMLAGLYAGQKQFDLAARHLEVVAAEQPTALLTLARLHALADRQATAQRVAQRARDHFQQLSKSEPMHPYHRLQWTEAELFLENFPQAVAVAAEGLQLAGDDAQNVASWRQVLATIYLSWFDSVSKTEADNLARRLELLQQALAFGPNHPRVLTRLAEFATREEERTPAALAELKRILAAGAAPGTVHFILGTAALTAGDTEQGVQHLQVAFAQVPQMPAIANNLAWGLANQAEPDLAQAEQLIDAAVELAPQHPEIRETRGQIRARLGRTKEAIADLELALQRLPGRREIHETLGQLYEQLGDADLARQHRDLASPPAKKK